LFLSKNITEKFGIVVFMDALATSGIWETEHAQSYLASWESLNFVMDIIIQDLGSYDNISCNDIITTKKAEYEIDIFTFSDTLIITVSITDKQNIVNGLSLIGNILMQLFFWGLKDKLLFRGVFSIDKFYALKTSSYLTAGIPVSESFTPTKKFLFIGPTVDEAARCYNKSNWIGISSMPSATIHLNEIDIKADPMRYFVKIDISKYGVNENGWALAWPRYDTLQNSLNPTNESHIQYLEQQKNFYHDDEKVFPKYDNTIRFYYDVNSMIDTE
jgi:hypothetical protein